MWKIESRLYLGDYRSGEAALGGEEQVLEPEGKLAPFAGVVSLCPMPLTLARPLEGPRHRNTEWLQIPIADGGAGEEELERALGVVVPFVERRIKHGNVLVHCAAGMSRSVSVVAAWLCRSGLSLDEALDRNHQRQDRRDGPAVEPRLAGDFARRGIPVVSAAYVRRALGPAAEIPLNSAACRAKYPIYAFSPLDLWVEVRKKAGRPEGRPWARLTWPRPTLRSSETRPASRPQKRS